MNAAGRVAADRTAQRHQIPQLGLLVSVLLSVAGVFGGLFSGLAWFAPLAIAVVAAAAVAALGCLGPGRAATDDGGHLAGGPAVPRPPGLLVVIPVATAGFAVYALAVLFGRQTAHGFAGPRAVVTALRGGWSTVLTVGLPADPTSSVLILPALLLWLATVAAVVLTLRGGSVFAPLVAPLAVFAVGLMLVAARGRAQLPVTAAVALTSLAFALVRAESAVPAGRRSRPGGRGAAAGGVLLGLPIVAAAAGLGVAGAAVAPIGGRFDPRDLRHPPVTVDTALNPLVQVRGQLTADPAASIATVRLASSTGRLPVDRITTAILDTFDGASWQADGQFVAVGTELPRGGAPSPAAEATVQADVTVHRLDSPFLLAPGRPERIRPTHSPRAARIGFDAATGALVTTAPVASGYRYTVTAVVPTPSKQRLASAVPGSGPALAADLSLPRDLPPRLVAVADQVTAAAATPYEQLTALATYLRDPRDFPYDLNGRPGYSYGALTRFLTSGDPDDRRGYSEQHATAFALLARIKGFPTRIAVGYLLTSAPAGSPAAQGGVFTITEHDAHAWPEVYLAGLGWIPFEPTDTSHLSRQDPITATPAASGGAGTTTPASTARQSKVTAIPEIAVNPAGGAGGRAYRAVRYSLAALVVVIVLALAAVLGEKRRRRWRRRTAGPPHQRIAGAWREVRDRLSEWGVPPTRTLSAGEVAGQAARLGAAAAEPVRMLVPLLSAALFDAGEPAEDDVRQAWELAGAVRRALPGCGPPYRRLTAAIDPRALLRRSR